MAISYPISLPAKGIKQIQLTMVNSVAVSTSPFTGQQQVYKHQGSRWKASIALVQMLRYEAEEWIAALGSLYGQYGTMLLGDPAGQTARGTISGSPTVNGGSQTGTTLTVNAITGTLLAGDYIQIGTGADSRLYKVLKDVASGGTSIEIFPRLRESPADSAAIIYEDTVGLFRLEKSESPFTYVSPKLASITFDVVEAI